MADHLIVGHKVLAVHSICSLQFNDLMVYTTCSFFNLHLADHQLRISIHKQFINFEVTGHVQAKVQCCVLDLVTAQEIPAVSEAIPEQRSVLPISPFGGIPDLTPLWKVDERPSSVRHLLLKSVSTRSERERTALRKKT